MKYGQGAFVPRSRSLSEGPGNFLVSYIFQSHLEAVTVLGAGHAVVAAAVSCICWAKE